MASSRKTVALAVLLSTASLVALVADASDAERIVVTNALLIGRDAPAQDVRANLLIVDHKLSVVSKGEPAIEPGDIVVDAAAGFLLGAFVLGEPPTFLILDQDPRENFDVLMDTKEHVCFAMKDGVIVKNELPEVPPVSPSETPQKQDGWKAYTPPPIAVPIRYYNGRKWNRFNTKSISGLFVGALLLDRQFWLSQDAGNEAQVGDLSGFEGGEIRGFRFGLVGSLKFKRPWRYTVFAATNTFDKGYDVDTTDEFQMFDYRLDIPLPADLMLSVGKQKEPISMERLSNLVFLPMQERSAVADALLPSRNFGLVLSGTAGGDWFSWAVGAFNNWIDSDESFSDTSNQFAGRITWVPTVSEDESNLLHLGLGVRHSDAKLPIRAATEPEFNNAPLFADTGPFSADDVMTYNLEAYWRKGPYLVAFEYLGSDVDSTESGNMFFNGYHLTASWAVTGEMRAYRKRSGIFDPLPVSRPVTHGGWGTLETGFRYSHLDLSDGAVDGGEMDSFSLGVNWWLTQSSQLSLNYRHITLDRFATTGDSSGINLRIMLSLN